MKGFETAINNNRYDLLRWTKCKLILDYEKGVLIDEDICGGLEGGRELSIYVGGRTSIPAVPRSLGR
jgi:hypothetical protein